MKYALLGFGDSYRAAPFYDASYSIIGLNELYKYIPDRGDGRGQFDEWVEIHDEDSIGLTKRAIGQDMAEVTAHREWLKRQAPGKPIWMQERFVGTFPAATAFPLAEIQRRFAPYAPGKNATEWNYLTSTIALELAMLILRGRDEHWQVTDDTAATWLGLFGIELIGQGEYQYQRPCAEWFCGFAAGLGIEVYIPEESALLSGPSIYGFDTPPEDHSAVTMRRVNARERKLKKMHDDQMKGIYETQGAIKENRNWRTVLEGFNRGVTHLPENFLDEGPAPNPEDVG